MIIQAIAGSSVHAGVDLTSGWEGDARRGYFFATSGWSFEIGASTAIVPRLTASHLYYRFREPDGEIRVSSPGGSVDAAFGFDLGKAVFVVGPGIEVRRERCTLETGEVFREWTVGPTFGMDVSTTVVDTLTDIELVASYAHASRYLSIRSGVKELVHTSCQGRFGLALGMEVSGQGNDEIRSYQWGGLIEAGLDRISISLRGGYSRLEFAEERGRSTGYLGIEFNLSSPLHRETEEGPPPPTGPSSADTLLSADLTEPASVSRIDSTLRAEEQDGFSGVVLIAHDDSVLFEKAYGTAAAAGSAHSPAFWLASDSKQFTAAAILRLQEAGRVSVSDSIGRFFRDVPNDKGAITIHQLLTHTSGLPHAYAADGELDREDAVTEILRLSLWSRPGEKYSYSNDGYNLLAAIIDIVSGVGFDEFVQDSLFARAGMTESGLWGHERSGVAIAPVHDPLRTRGVQPTIYQDGHSVANWGYRGATGSYATARDVHSWIQALRKGKILSHESLRALLGRHVLVREDSTGQSFAGYGWGVRVVNGQDVSYGHVGDEDWLGHNAVIRFSPEGDVVVVLSNSGEVDGVGWSTRVNRAIRRVMDDR